MRFHYTLFENTRHILISYKPQYHYRITKVVYMYLQTTTYVTVTDYNITMV